MLPQSKPPHTQTSSSLFSGLNPTILKHGVAKVYTRKRWWATQDDVATESKAFSVLMVSLPSACWNTKHILHTGGLTICPLYSRFNHSTNGRTITYCIILITTLKNVEFHLVFWIIHLQKLIALTFNKTFMICIMQHLHLLFFFPAQWISFFMIHYSKISLIHFSSALDKGIFQNLSQSNICYPLNCNCNCNPYSY